VRSVQWLLAAAGLATGAFLVLSACGDLWSEIPGSGDASLDGESDEAGLEDAGPEDPDAPSDLMAFVVSPEDFTTGAPGLSAEFQGRIACPNEERPCKGRWSLSTGQAGEGESLGRVTFAQAGYYQGTFTARGRSDAQASATVHLAAWTKNFSDNFNRAALEPTKNGWRLPSLDQSQPDASGSYFYAVDNSWLRVTGDTSAPGSSALLAYPKVQNGRGQFKQRRTTPLNGDHYTDLVLRYDPKSPDGRFYRVRVHEYNEQGGLNRGEVVELAIFRITRDDNQHGHMMNNRRPYWENPVLDGGIPTYQDAGVQGPELVGYLYPPGPIIDSPDDQCFASNGHPTGLPQYPPGDPGCPTAQLAPVAQLDAYRLEVQAAGPKITFKLYGYKLPNGAEKLLLSDAVTDTAPDAISAAGLWGVAHFAGISYMDDFVLESQDP
jgi:hypothetical protein